MSSFKCETVLNTYLTNFGCELFISYNWTKTIKFNKSLNKQL